MAEEELPPSKLGTKDHWDGVYDREVRVFNDVGDEGEVWFGESSVTKMRKWAQRNIPDTDRTVRILECGSGNGTLLLSFLSSIGPKPIKKQKFHLTGIDYCEGASILAESIAKTRIENLSEDLTEDEEDEYYSNRDRNESDEGEEDEDDEDDVEIEKVINDIEGIDWRTEDLLTKDLAEQWDLVLDKGTYDALCLSQDTVQEQDGRSRLPSQIYPERISNLVKQNGFFLITSCNFTEEEIKSRYTKEGLGLEFHSSVPHPSFSFGGKSGTTVCTVAFKKVSPS
ncbi:uncharacterized protein L201_000732 [Kwoniella dendrophila CBS 6074]|uniref:Protein-lysine N-methyltransferase EFM4 n=1 Tax=Kwoniella dendrophila CBS 6074 TaxID=1295534 RepID=A0AAX4JMV8_9TREE